MATDPNVIMGTTSTVRTTVDGGMKLTIDIAPADMQRAFALFGTPGAAIGMARLTVETAKKQAQKDAAAPAVENHGKAYQCLFKLGFFNNPRVKRGLNFPPAATPDEIKAFLHSELQVESLADVAPSRFMDYCRSAGIVDALPREFGA